MTTRPSRTTRWIAALVATAVLVAVPGAAGAQTSDTRPPADKRQTEPARGDRTYDMEQAKERAKQAIDVRIVALDETIARLQAAELVTEEHKVRLVRELEAVKASLQQLRRQIEAEEDPEALKRLMQRIVTDHYVFAFQIPRARIVAGADVAVAVSAKLRGVADRLEVKILEAEERGHDMSTARRHLKALRDKSAGAGGIGAKVGPEVLDLKVEGYPDNKPVLERSRRALEHARTLLKESHAHARAIVQELKAAGQA